jgi:hypothetical protein
MSDPAIGKPVRDARQRLQQAYGVLNGTDIRTITVAEEYLAESLALLATFRLSLESGKPQVPAEIRSEVVAIQKEVVLLIQMVDARATFYRGLNVRLGNSGVFYTRGGDAIQQAAQLELKLHG